MEQLLNQMWDAGVLPLIQPGNGRQLIARARLDDLLHVVRPTIESLLASVRFERHMGCLEWDTIHYIGGIFKRLCPPDELHTFSYSPTIDPKVGVEFVHKPDSRAGRFMGTSTYALDLCATPLAPEMLEHVAKHGGFKLVVATSVFEHLAQPFTCAANLYRLVAAGGLIVLTAPFIFHYHRMPDDYYRYSVAGLREVVTKAGFELVYNASQGDMRETQAMLAGFPYSAVPSHAFRPPHNTFTEAMDMFFHQVIVVAQRRK